MEYHPTRLAGFLRMTIMDWFPANIADFYPTGVRARIKSILMHCLLHGCRVVYRVNTERGRSQVHQTSFMYPFSVYLHGSVREYC